MISRLHIENYALIDKLDIEFTPGLNIITGETGAGKSIILGALSLLLGERASSRSIRVPDRKSIVEAVFSVGDMESLRQWADANDIDWCDDCILRRELLPGGRTRSFVNDTPVNLSQLAELGRRLIDIHSQNRNQLLADKAFQLQVIDGIAADSALLQQYRGEYTRWTEAERKLKSTLKALEQSRADEEFIRFRLSQLDSAQLIAGEQEELESERELQANMTQIKQTLTDVLTLLSNGDAPALDSLSDAVDATYELSEVIDGVADLAKRLEVARVEIQDIAETLADYDSNLSADPQALEQIEERLGEIYSLQKRHNVDSVEALIEIRNDLRKRLEMISDGDMAIDELRLEAESAKKVALKTAAKLSAVRKEAADKFAAELCASAQPLGMPNLRCEIAVDTLDRLTPDGIDDIEFRFAFNKNQQPQPVGGAASGGEISRLMLCLKSIVAGRMMLPTIVFDEVDTGVSGDVANRMGLMMAQMSNDIQVLTITHLPQVAAKGVSHYKVYKQDDSEATHTRISRLTDDERVGELALMLSGSATDSAAIANAKSLLKNGKN